VVTGLVFLGFEVRQNTLAIEREVSISFADNIHGALADSDYLAPIVTKLMNKEGLAPEVAALIAAYDLSPLEAQRWFRFLLQNWLRHQADWIYRGRIPGDCREEIFLMSFRDNQIITEIEAVFDPEFVVCFRGGLQ